MVDTVTVTPPPATCWISFCRSRRTRTLALDQPPQAQWVQDQVLAVTAVGLQLVEPQEAEQVSRNLSHRILGDTIKKY